jgi:hypothetical protein
MRRSLLSLFFCATVGFCAMAQTAFGQEQAQNQREVAKEAHFAVKPGQSLVVEKIKKDLASTGSSSATSLPLWVYNVESSRDGNDYTGVMVGANPFTRSGKKNVSVKTYVVPLIIVTHRIATNIDFTTGHISTTPGETTFDSTAANVCLNTPNNVPSTLLAESPILSAADFSFGSVSMGTTEYSDAFQRGNFWEALGANGTTDTYHMRLSPVRFLDPILINVPSRYGLAGTTPLLFGPPPICPPFGIIDINWFDAYLDSTVLPALAAQGVSPANVPFFQLSNVVLASPVTDYFTCCIGGYHSWTSLPIQTYGVGDFDSSLFFIDAASQDTGILSHEVDEWMDDPFGDNPVPAWGHVGQQSGCQNNLEVGDPLTGTEFPAVTMSNGFTYHLQELAFFSWFFGAPSIGVNGWYSDNGTFVSDAGPPCQ